MQITLGLLVSTHLRRKKYEHEIGSSLPKVPVEKITNLWRKPPPMDEIPKKTLVIQMRGTGFYNLSHFYTIHYIISISFQGVTRVSGFKSNSQTWETSGKALPFLRPKI